MFLVIIFYVRVLIRLGNSIAIYVERLVYICFFREVFLYSGVIDSVVVLFRVIEIVKLLIKGIKSKNVV